MGGLITANVSEEDKICKEIKLVSGMFYFYGDHLGSSSVVTDGTGKVVQTTDYYPYGGVRHEFTDESFENDFLYTGKELDEELGIYYYGARYYMADVGRWMGEDPMVLDFNRDQLKKLLTDPQSWNAYAYVRNNPILNIDPDGAEWWTKLNNAANKAINVATAVIPVVSDVRDFVEFQTGKDAVYQTPLSQEQKDMAGLYFMLPVVSGSGSRIGEEVFRQLDEAKVLGTVRDNLLNDLQKIDADKIYKETKLIVEGHALEAMHTRGISTEQFIKTFKEGEVFQYVQEGRNQVGYYAREAKMFFGRVGNNVTTVINNVKDKYIENVKKR